MAGRRGGAALTHAELEDRLGMRGRELLRRMFQAQLDLRALREQRRDGVAGADGIGGPGRKGITAGRWRRCSGR